MAPTRSLRPLALAAALGGILAFHCVNNLILLTHNHVAPTYDAVEYLNLAIQIFHAPASLLETEVRPPIPPAVAALFLAVSGASERAASFGPNLLFLWVLVLSVHGIGLTLYRDQLSALLSAAVVSLFPLVFAHSRLPMADLPLTAAVALFFLLWLRSRHFARRWTSLSVGVTVGVGLLVKPLFPLFALPAYLISGVVLLRGRRATGPVRWIHLAGSLVLGLFIAAPWYATRLPWIWSRFVGANIPSSSETFHFDPTFFVANLWEEQLGALVLALAVGVVLAARHLPRAALIVMGLTFLLPCLLMSTMPVKLGRYAMPLLPVLALAIGAIGSLGRPRWRRAAVAGVLALAVVQYLFVSYCPAARRTFPVLRDRVYVDRSPGGRPLIGRDYIHHGLHQAEDDLWGRALVSRTLDRCASDLPIVTAVGCPAVVSFGLYVDLRLRPAGARDWITSEDICYPEGHEAQVARLRHLEREEVAELAVLCGGWEPSCEAATLLQARYARGRYRVLATTTLANGQPVRIVGRNLSCAGRAGRSAR